MKKIIIYANNIWEIKYNSTNDKRFVCTGHVDGKDCVVVFVPDKESDKFIMCIIFNTLFLKRNFTYISDKPLDKLFVDKLLDNSIIGDNYDIEYWY